MRIFYFILLFAGLHLQDTSNINEELDTAVSQCVQIINDTPGELNMIYECLNTLLENFKAKKIPESFSVPINEALKTLHEKGNPMFDTFALRWDWCYGYNESIKEIEIYANQYIENIQSLNKKQIISDNEKRKYKDIRGGEYFFIFVLFLLDRSKRLEKTDEVKTILQNAVEQITLPTNQPFQFYYLKFKYAGDSDLAWKFYLKQGIKKYPNSKTLLETFVIWTGAVENFDYQPIMEYEIKLFKGQLPSSCEEDIIDSLLSKDSWEGAMELEFPCPGVNNRKLFKKIMLYLVYAHKFTFTFSIAKKKNIISLMDPYDLKNENNELLKLENLIFDIVDQLERKIKAKIVELAESDEAKDQFIEYIKECVKKPENLLRTASFHKYRQKNHAKTFFSRSVSGTKDRPEKQGRPKKLERSLTFQNISQADNTGGTKKRSARRKSLTRNLRKDGRKKIPKRRNSLSQSGIKTIRSAMRAKPKESDNNTEQQQPHHHVGSEPVSNRPPSNVVSNRESVNQTLSKDDGNPIDSSNTPGTTDLGTNANQQKRQDSNSFQHDRLSEEAPINSVEESELALQNALKFYEQL